MDLKLVTKYITEDIHLYTHKCANKNVTTNKLYIYPLEDHNIGMCSYLLHSLLAFLKQ